MFVNFVILIMIPVWFSSVRWQSASSTRVKTLLCKDCRTLWLGNQSKENRKKDKKLFGDRSIIRLQSIQDFSSLDCIIVSSEVKLEKLRWPFKSSKTIPEAFILNNYQSILLCLPYVYSEIPKTANSKNIMFIWQKVHVCWTKIGDGILSWTNNFSVWGIKP